MATLADIRREHPEYNDLSDQELAQRLHDRYYSDIPFEDFSRRVGLTSAPTQQNPPADAQRPAQPQRPQPSPDVAASARRSTQQAAAARNVMRLMTLPIMGPIDMPIIETMTDPRRRAEALRGIGSFARDFAGFFNQNPSQAAGQIARGAQRGAAAAPAAIVDAVTHPVRTVRGMTVGPLIDEEAAQQQLDYARAIGDTEGATQAANEANNQTVSAGINGIGAATGGIAGRGASFVGNVLRGGAIGGGFGATTGFLTTPGDLEARTEGATQGGISAAALGAGLTAAIDAPRVVGDLNRGPRMARRQAWNDQADARDLEQEFGPMTAGERSGDPRAVQREDALRRAGPTAAQDTLRNFDNARAEDIQNNLMRRVATRGQDPITPDEGSAGTLIADELRTQLDRMEAEQARRYQRVRELAGNERVSANQVANELTDRVNAVVDQDFLDVPGAQSVIGRLQRQISEGQATYLSVERARQALNRQLGSAMRSGDDAQAYALHRVIDELDAFAEPKLSPEARQALHEARAYTREMLNWYGQQARPNLATGHVGRRDPGGSVIRNIVETDLTGQQVIDSIFGSTTRPPRSVLGAVQRIKDNATQQISTGGYEAPTGAGRGQEVRARGRRTMRGGRATRGGRQFDPSPAQEARFGTELPPSELQALREAFVHRLNRRLSGRNAGDAIPARTMATQLRQALHGPGAEITRIIFNDKEIAAMERALAFLDRISQPSGSYSPSGPGIAQDMAERSMAALVGRLIGKIPVVGSGIGQAIEQGVVNARAIKDARNAVATPREPPRVNMAPVGRSSALPGALGVGIGGYVARNDQQPMRNAGGVSFANEDQSAPPTGDRPIDLSRPMLDNPDGSFSTERTITVGAEGGFYNIPTIVNGRRHTPEEAIALWRAGRNPEVGVYRTEPEALRAAEQRSARIGRIREPERVH